MKTKIYLAKSNRANPDHVQAVRSTLKEFDVEVVEYTGGGYSHKPLLKCDMLVVLPELKGDEEDEEYVPLGKGLHEQIQAFEHHVNKCDILIVYECNDKWGASITGLDGIDVADTDNYVNYSFAILDQDRGCQLKDMLENRCGVRQASTNTSTSNGRYRLLLTRG
jgi:hypothetical protein